MAERSFHQKTMNPHRHYITVIVLLVITITFLSLLIAVAYDMIQRTTYIEFEQDYDWVDITSITLYPNLIKTDEWATITVKIESHAKTETLPQVMVHIQNSPELWEFENGLRGTGWSTLSPNEEGIMGLRLKANDMAGTIMTEIIVVRLIDDDGTIIEEKTLPIRVEWQQ